MELACCRHVRVRRHHAAGPALSAPGLDEAVWLTWSASAPTILLA